MQIRANQFLNYIDARRSRLLVMDIFLLLILSQMIYPQSDSLIIEHYTIEQGLSNSSVDAILQDKEGYLWFATRKGIEKYDGYKFQSYINNPEDNTSFINASAIQFYEDREGTLWIGTTYGLEKYNPLTNSFTHYLPDHSEKGQLGANYIYCMTEDSLGIFWLTTKKGVYKFNKSSGKFSHVRYDMDSTDTIYPTYSPIFVDKDGSLWIGTPYGLDKYNYEKSKLVHYWSNPEKQQIHVGTISKYRIIYIQEDKDGILWLGTSNGLVEFNKKQNTFTNYLPDSSIHAQFDVNHLGGFFIDPSGLLWIGTARGIFTFDKKLKKFTPQFIIKSIKDFYLGNNFIEMLYMDNSGILWVGTLEDGIYKVILKKPSYKKYYPGTIHSIIKGDDGILWIKKRPEGWAILDTKLDQITSVNLTDEQYIIIDQYGNTFYREEVPGYIVTVKDEKITRYRLLQEPSTMYFESNKGIWYGALQGGLYFLDYKTDKVSEIIHTETYITAIHKDLSGLVWAGTYVGKLICYNTKNNSISEFISDPKDSASISGKTIFDIYEDKTGNLWFATNAGLNMFVSSTRTFIHFSEKNGLSGNTVYNILEDDRGNLWLSTNKGISKFNPVTNQFKNFDALKGLSSSNWYNNLAVKMDNGEMFFGRSYGLIRFHPDSIRENTYIPPIVITSIRLFDKPIPLGTEIKLTYDKNFLSFEFAALNYYNSERNQYAYKMEGVDEDWIYSGARRYASYPNMEPGKYIFRVKGSNNDGIWNETGTSISIIILPPWWKTTWAYIFYGFIFVFTLYGIRRYELNRIKLKDKVKLDAAVLKEREETDKIKSRFFANISHEFRTPLTLIQGPAEKIISDNSDNIKKDAALIKKNSARLLQLVNQLLELSKLEAGKLKLEASKGNIVSFVKGIVLSFESLSEEKDITLKILSEKNLIEVYFDKEKMIKILSNILSNAFKFTNQNGKITVSIKTKFSLSANLFNGESNEGYVEIKIKDTGIGIPHEEIPKLFDRFYQVDSSFTKEYQGTGIGLALTKELVELHYGNISVRSEKGNPAESGTGWTEFILNFPLGRGHLKDEEIVPDENTNGLKEPVNEEDYYLSIQSKTENEVDTDAVREEKNIVLVVEDNYDMREYIKESIGEDYFVEEAINGEQGVRKAESIIPDLIISDMMMPKMDGNEFTRVLKNDERTSHIPIIILTAKSGQESKLEGLETGADDYITKPFDIKELQVKIKNLINIRRKLQEKFRNTEFVNIKKGNYSLIDQIRTLELKGFDEKFINKVLNFIEEHISEESFTIEELGKEVGMSRAQFYRKITALTGMAPRIYLRTVRLARAKKMIEEKQGNISEIAYSVGFSSPSYFAKCFKEEFGYTPSNVTS